MKPYNLYVTPRLGVSACRAAIPAILYVLLLAWSAPAIGESIKPEASETLNGAAQEAQDPPEFEFTVGDRVNVRLFERYVPDDGTGSLSSLIEFPEVSGEYVVQQDGKIFLPLLGELDVAGKTHQSLREEVARRFQDSHGRAAEFTVRLVDRDPVYVTGDVTSPGAYRHVPAMTALHAITLAGGLPGTGADVWRRFDLAREKERLRQTELTMARLEAKSVVLEAEAGNRQPIPTPALVGMVGQGQANELVQKALALRTLERQRVTAEDEAHKTLIEKLEAELAVMKEAVVESENTVALRVKRVEAAASLHGKGLASEASYNIASDSLVEARSNWHERRMALANLQRSLVEAQQVHQRLNLDDLLERERERAALRAQIADSKISRQTISQMLVGATGYTASPRSAQAQFKIIILRRNVNNLAKILLDEHTLLKAEHLIRMHNGLVEFEVDEHALLHPGDLIKIQVHPEEQAMLPSEIR